MSALNIAELNNAKLDVDHIAAIATSAAPTATDRLGGTKKTVKGAVDFIEAALDAALNEAQGELNIAKADAAASAAEALGYLQAYRATSYGALASDPVVDPNGNALTVGDEYFNTTSNLLFRYNGATWQASDINTGNLAAPDGVLLVGNAVDKRTLLSSIGTSLMGFIQSGAGAVKQTLQDLLRERVSINSFLTTPGVITQADYDKAKVRALAAGGVLHITGDYSFDSLNIAAENLTVKCGPRTTLTHTGVGNGLVIDGGGVDGGGVGIGQGMFNFFLHGNPLVVGNANTTDGVYIRAMHHSEIQVRATDVTTGTRVHFGVCTKYKITVSVNERAFVRQPTTGLVTGLRAEGEFIQDCEFYVVIEGVAGVGVDLYNTVGCEFRGTSEGNSIGTRESGTCSKNRHVGMDWEANKTRDVESDAENGTYIDCLAISLGSGSNCELIAARGAKFIGGFWRTVNMQAGSADTLFIGVATSDNAALGFRGTGTYKAINCVKQDASGLTTGRIRDRIGEANGVWTPSFATAGGGVQGAVTTAVGTRCRVGPMEFVQGSMVIAKGSLGAGAVSVAGLFSAARNTANGHQYISVGEWSGIALGAGYSALSLRIAPGSSIGTLIKSGTGVVPAVVNLADFADPMELKFSGVYEAQ
jgi:hypothetical protein